MSVQASTSNKGGFLEGIASYVSTKGTDGIFVLFSACSHVARYAQLRPGISAESLAYAQRAQTTFDNASDALVVPDLLTTAVSLKQNYTKLQTLDSSSKKAQQVQKKMVIDGIQTAGYACDTARFFHSSQLTNLGRAHPFVGAGYNAAFFVTNTIESVDAVKEVQQNQGLLAKAKSDTERTTLGEKIHRAWLKVAKSSTYAAICGLSLAGLILPTLFEGVVFFPIVLLALSTIYLISKLALFFQEKKVKALQKP